MNRFNNDFYNYASDRLDDIIRIFNNYFGEEDNSDGANGGSVGGIGGIGGSNGSTSKFTKFKAKIGDLMDKADRIDRSVNRTVSSFKSMYGELNHILEPWAKADKAASKYAKTLAMTEQGMKNLRKNTIDNVVNSKIGINYNISTDELIEAQQKYVQSVGRSLRIDNTQQETLAAMTAVMGDRSTELAAAFENFGVNLNSVGDHAFKMFTEASKSGLSFEKYSDNVAKNIKIAQNYTFKNGLRGLESMAKKATALKLDMGQVASFADKVSTIEGSIDVASKLQVLGGQFAAIADPMAMLSEGLMDMEGLTDRIIKMVGGLGNFNKTTGEVEVSAFNKQRIKAAAQAMGMDYSQLMESVNASTRREAIDREISSSAHARGLNDDMKELLKNTATFDKNGKAGVSVNGEFVNLEDLTNEDYDVLVKETQSEAADIKDIARMLRSIEDVQKGTRKQYEANKAQVIEKYGVGDFTKNVIKGIGEVNWWLKFIALGSIGKSIASIGLTAFNIPSNFKGIKGLGKTSTSGGGKSISIANGIGNSEGVSENILNGGTKVKTRPGNEFTITRDITEYKKAIKTAKGLKMAERGSQAAKVGKTALRLGKGSGVLAGITEGVITGIDEFGSEKNYGTGKKVGRTTGAAVGGGLGALGGGSAGAAIGTLIFPGVGTAIGGLIGAIAGGVGGSGIGKWIGGGFASQERRERKKKEFELTNVKGDYSVSKLRKIKRGLETGEISGRMRRKLQKQGDTEILDAIDKKKSETVTKTNVAKGNFSVKNAYFNGIPFGVGKIGPDITKPNVLENTFKIAETNRIKGIPETGKGITPHQRVQTASLNGNQGRNGYDINISGTIKLMSANGKEVDITDNLLSNQTFVRELTEKIIIQTGENNHAVRRADVNAMGRM